ncbi:hypothetical protein D521_0453 [beta proteobacterium CB]|nr:hypothetical protein D521_0453 [beta proteobacterium CB]
MIKQTIFAALAASLLFTGTAKAQVYNESASARQSASAEMGMYQITLAALRASDLYNGDSTASQFIRKQINKTKFGGEACITVNNSGFPTPVRDPVTLRQVKTYSYWVAQELIDAVYAQRDMYISLSKIANSSFPIIKNGNMNRQQAVNYLSQRIDLDLVGLLKKNDFEGTANISTNVSGSGEYCQGDIGDGLGLNRSAINKKYQIEYPRSTELSGTKASADFIRDYSANFDDGFILKSNGGAPDLTFRGQPWFSEAGIQGQKLSIGSSSEKGSNTTQKRGE